MQRVVCLLTTAVIDRGTMFQFECYGDWQHGEHHAGDDLTPHAVGLLGIRDITHAFFDTPEQYFPNNTIYQHTQIKTEKEKGGKMNDSAILDMISDICNYDAYCAKHLR